MSGLGWTRVNDGMMQMGPYWILKTAMYVAPKDVNVITYICYKLTSSGLQYLSGADTFKEAQAIMSKAMQAEQDND
jgi:hypothetical protein